MSDPVRPLDGIRILDLTHVLSGPFCTYQLGLLGADVIKVEEPRLGDYMRRRGSDDALRRRLMGDHFLSLNANKRSIAVDLKRPEGAAVVQRLALRSDVLVENFCGGVMDRLGLGETTLRAHNPRLVYCAISAYGRGGPDAGRKAYDHVVQASSGMMAGTGFPGATPIKTGSPVLDYATGAMSAFAVMAALFHRERTGQGQFIDVAMQDTALMLMSTSLMNLLHGGHAPSLHGNDHALAAASCYVAKDGALIMLGCCTQGQFETLCRLVGRDDLLTDQRFRDVNWQDRAALAAELAATMRTRSADEWEALLAGHVPASRVRSLEDAVARAALNGRGVIQTTRVPGVDDPIPVPAAAFLSSAGGPAVARRPPRLGEHTDEILRHFGFSSDEIAALHAARAVANWDPARSL